MIAPEVCGGISRFPGIVFAELFYLPKPESVYY